MQTVFYAGKCSLLSLDKFKATEFDWLRGCLEFYGPFLGEVQKKKSIVQFGLNWDARKSYIILFTSSL